MRTVSDLGRMFKLRYPGAYDDMSDIEVGRMFQEAYSPAYDDYTEEALELRQNTTPVSKPSDILRNPLQAASNYSSPQHNFPTEQYIERLLDYYNPKKGRFASWWPKGQTQSRTELITLLNEEQLAVIQAGATLAQQVLDGYKKEIEFRDFLVKNAIMLNQLMHNQYLDQIAMDEGLSTIESQRLRVEARNTELRLIEKDKGVDIDLKKKREETKIERDDFEAREQIKLDIEFEQATNTFKAIANYKNITYDQLEEIRGRIFALIKEEDQIERSHELSPQAKGSMLDEIREMKGMYKEILDAQRRRLVEAGNGEEAGGIDSVADLISSSTTGRKTTKQPLPVKESRDDE